MTDPSTERVPEPSWNECMELLDKLPTLPAEARVEAIERLVRNSSPVIRERALRTGAAVVPDDRVEHYLRSDADDVLRNAGLEMLKMRGARGLPLAVRLLKDDDPDVVLQAVLALGHARDLRALEPLRATLHHGDANVVQAAIEAVGKLGDARAIPDLLPFLVAEPWLQMATIQALGDVRSPASVGPLADLLTDLLMGPVAAESLARIGGPEAFRILADHWLEFREETDPETVVGYLAHVVEGLLETPSPRPELRESLAPLLESEEATVRSDAARALLALGPGPEDARALGLLAEGASDLIVLPTCLSRRSDLISRLAGRPGKERSWAFLLAGRFPERAPVEALARALVEEIPPPELLGSLLRALGRIHSPVLANALLDTYLAATTDYRHALAPLMATHRDELREALSRREDFEPEAHLILMAHLGAEPHDVARQIVELPDDVRLRVLELVTEQEAVVRLLPWGEWVHTDPARYLGIAAKVAAEIGLRDLLPELRNRLREHPDPDLVRSFGELGDRESVPHLVALLGPSDPRVGPLVLESLGRIGGPEARRALRQTIADGTYEPRLAYRALSLCAIEEDDAVFRRAVGHSDWYVRLACAEVLGRFVRPENLAALSQLAADPIAIVAQRALSFLEA